MFSFEFIYLQICTRYNLFVLRKKSYQLLICRVAKNILGLEFLNHFIRSSKVAYKWVAYKTIQCIRIKLVDVHRNWLNWFCFVTIIGDLLIILTDYMIFLWPFLDVIRMSMPTVYFFTCLGCGIFCMKNVLCCPMI